MIAYYQPTTVYYCTLNTHAHTNTVCMNVHGVCLHTYTMHIRTMCAYAYIHMHTHTQLTCMTACARCMHTYTYTPCTHAMCVWMVYTFTIHAHTHKVYVHGYM